MFTTWEVNSIFKDEVRKAINAGLPIPNEVKTLIPTYTSAKSFLGQCKFCGKYIVAIRLSKWLLQYDNDYQLRETIAHELVHTCCPLDGHGKMFKMYASMFNRACGHHISRTASHEETNEFLRIANYHKATKMYAVKCPKCGRITERAKFSKVIAHPEQFMCKICNVTLVRIA